MVAMKTPATLREHPPFIEAERRVEFCRRRKAEAEAALDAARRMAREGALNRADRVAAMARGEEPPSIYPDDRQVIQAEEDRATALEALLEAARHRDEVQGGYGNDSRQNGPLSSRFLHNDRAGWFAFSLILRTRRPSQQAHSAPGDRQRAPRFRPF